MPRAKLSSSFRKLSARVWIDGRLPSAFGPQDTADWSRGDSRLPSRELEKDEPTARKVSRATGDKGHHRINKLHLDRNARHEAQLPTIRKSLPYLSSGPIDPKFIPCPSIIPGDRAQKEGLPSLTQNGTYQQLNVREWTGLTCW